MIAAIDGSQTGDIKTTKWAVKGDQFGFSSPVIDGDARLPDRQRLAAAGLRRRDRAASSGRSRSARCRRRRSVLADGKLYVGTESGKFFIVRPRADRARGPERSRAAAQQEQRAAGRRARRSRSSRGAAVSRGRVFFVSSDAVYAIGPKTAKRRHGLRGRRAGASRAKARRRSCRSSPTELVLKPGQTRQAARAAVRRARDGSCARTTGHVVARGAEGHGRPTARSPWRAIRSNRPGSIKATVGALTGEARARVVRPLPWTETFESYADGAVPPGWVNAVAGKFSVTTLDGQKVLQKAPDETIFKRIRMFIGPDGLVELHVRGRRARARRGGGRWATSASPRSATRSCSTATPSS